MSIGNFGTGIVTGLVIGSVVSMAMNKNPRKVSSMKRNVSKTLKHLGNMVDGYR